MPYQEEPWKSRYPNLADIMEDHSGAPKYNVVRHNVIVRSGEIEVEQNAQEYVTVESNLITQEDPGFVDAAQMDFRLREDSHVYIRLPSFETIPFEKIGPR